MDFQYSLFGLLFHSNLPLPGVSITDLELNSPDIELHLGVSPHLDGNHSGDTEELTYESSDSSEGSEPALRVWNVAKGTFLRVAYSDGTQFWVDRRRENLWATWPATSSLEEASTYLLGPILGLVLRLRGVTCLHASAVALGDCSVVFVGAEGTGKSTTAAAFARQGHAVISDDVAALVETEEGFRVVPAYPHLSLWPDSVEVLYGSAEALPRFSPGWGKRRLALGDQGTRFEKRPMPLGAIYVLGDRRPDPAPYVEKMQPQSALLSLVAGTFANKILDRDHRAHEFEILGRLATMVPIRRIHPHYDATRLEELCRTIRKDFESLDLGTLACP